MSKSEIVGNRAANEQPTLRNNRRGRNQDTYDHTDFTRREEAFDETLKNTFPASDPVSIGLPTLLHSRV
jgi:hypothetical protein